MAQNLGRPSEFLVAGQGGSYTRSDMGVYQVSLTGLAHTPRLGPAFWPSIPVRGLSWARDLILCEFCCHQGPTRDYRRIEGLEHEPLVAGRKRSGVQGVHLNLLAVFLRPPIQSIWVF